MEIFAQKRLNKTPTIRRLPVYLNRLLEYKAKGISIITSNDLARDMDLLPIVVKKDLQTVSPPTKKRAGYLVDGTIDAIRAFLDWDTPFTAILVGVGHLGSALLGYKGMTGLSFVGAFDAAPSLIGKEVRGMRVQDMKDLQKFIQKTPVDIAVLTVPAAVAQQIADHLSSLPIKAIWNFTPAKLHVPSDIALQREDLSAGLAELCAKIKHLN